MVVSKNNDNNAGLYSASCSKTSNVLVTLVAAKEDWFQRPFNGVKAVRISEFIWQRVPDIVACLIAIRTDSTVG